MVVDCVILYNALAFLIGSDLGVWTGGFSCPGESVALLCCVATGGFHSCSQYQWFFNDEILDEECHAITYVTSCGSYSCVLTTATEKKTFSFEVQGNACNVCALSCCVTVLSLSALADSSTGRWVVISPKGVTVNQGIVQ